MRWVRWYSAQSCQWSKWRWLGQDWLDSDPTVALQMSHGQHVQIVDVLPVGARIKKGHDGRGATTPMVVLSRWNRTVAHLRNKLGMIVLAKQEGTYENI